MPRISSSASTGPSSNAYIISISEDGNPSPALAIDSDLAGSPSFPIAINSSSSELAGSSSSPITIESASSKEQSSKSPAKRGHRSHVRPRKCFIEIDSSDEDSEIPAEDMNGQVSMSPFGPGKINRPRKCFIEIDSADEDTEISDSERVPKTRVRVGNLRSGYCYLCEEKILRLGPAFNGFLGHIRNSMQHLRALDKRIHGGDGMSGEEVNGEYRVERGVLVMYAESSTQTIGTIFKTGSAANRNSICKARQNWSRSFSPSPAPEKKLQTPCRRSDRLAEASAAASLKTAQSARYLTRSVARRLSSPLANTHT